MNEEYLEAALHRDLGIDKCTLKKYKMHPLVVGTGVFPQEGRGQWTVYYTSSQSFMITFFIRFSLYYFGDF